MTTSDPIPPTIEWADDRVRMIDQRQLPGALVFIESSTVEALCGAIRALAIRGAPALGAAGAMGVALAVVNGDDLDEASRRLKATRPTAVNLAWGVDRARRADDPIAEAVAIATEDVARNRAIGRHGAVLIPMEGRVLTHCNAGSLACVGYGTAIGIIRAAHEDGRRPTVWVDETRPVLQGSRLTAWELQRLQIPATLIPDVLAASLIGGGEVDCIIVGADRIAANGDVANKVGTYGLAVVAARHRVPFYVAAPTSTIDDACPDGQSIPIEHRSGNEVSELAGTRVAPAGIDVGNRAFDITPAELVTAVVTERGIIPPGGIRAL